KLGTRQVDDVQLGLVGEHNLKSAVAAAGVATMMGVPNATIKKQLATLKPMAGRMQLIRGKNGSTIIDDTYNASPQAVKAALQTLYGLPKSGRKIAVLGSMNELGATSQRAHQQIGRDCDRGHLDQVITIGREAAQYLAPAATAAGCQVESFLSPYAAGRYLARRLQKGDIVLAKGSQNGVFAEEAVAQLLASSQDKVKLVRQGGNWPQIKARQFHI
ncbi:MAG: glutamate ligase domain-containing protein, partial [Acidobacteriota bacterium]